MSYARTYLKSKKKEELTEQELDKLFQETLSELARALEGWGNYHKWHKRPDLERAISKAEAELGEAWTQALAGAPGSGERFKEALESYRKAFMISIQAFIHSGKRKGREGPCQKS